MTYDMDDAVSECPLCMEQLDPDDLNFFPCSCGYQICRFCWHRIRTDENGLCPACRGQYSESPADFRPMTAEQLRRVRAQKKGGGGGGGAAEPGGRRRLAGVRVLQDNLVFVAGLSSRLADPEVLKRREYFGRFGKIRKVVVNHATQGASGTQSASAHVTFYRSEDALRAIQAVNNVTVDSRTLKASLGTTKYCSHYMRNQHCPKTDCMYLHELGDEAASFTKEAMQQGKHQEYEKKLHDQLKQAQIKTAKDRRAEQVRSLSEPGAAVASVSVPTGNAWSSPGKEAACGTAVCQQQGGKKTRGRRGKRRGQRAPSPARSPPAAPSGHQSDGDGEMSTCCQEAPAGPTPPPESGSGGQEELQAPGQPSPPPEQPTPPPEPEEEDGLDPACLGQPTPPPEEEEQQQQQTGGWQPQQSLLDPACLGQPTPPPEPEEDDGLDFDPFEETEKGLSLLVERERQLLLRRGPAPPPPGFPGRTQPLQQQQQQRLHNPAADVFGGAKLSLFPGGDYPRQQQQYLRSSGPTLLEQSGPVDGLHRLLTAGRLMEGGPRASPHLSSQLQHYSSLSGPGWGGDVSDWASRPPPAPVSAAAAHLHRQPPAAPPHWLRSVEQLVDSPAPAPAQTSYLACPPPVSRAWPPAPWTSAPPPGFSSSHGSGHYLTSINNGL